MISENHVCLTNFGKQLCGKFHKYTKKILVTVTYLLTPWCRVLLEKLTVLQLVKKFPAFHGTRMFITALTSVRQLSLFWASLILSIYTHPTSWISILMLSTLLCLGLPSGLLTSGFPTKTLYTPLSSTHTRHMPSQSQLVSVNLLAPNVNYSGRTATLTSKVAFYVFIQQI